jgi:hypothetical protein
VTVGGVVPARAPLGVAVGGVERGVVVGTGVSTVAEALEPAKEAAASTAKKPVSAQPPAAAARVHPESRRNA